jgi:hypothetical protein
MDEGRYVVKSDDGFTALEILAAVIVLLILCAVCARPLGGLLERIKLQNAADGMKHYVLNARLRAVSSPDRHCGVVFRFHPGTSTDDSVFAFLETDPPDKMFTQGHDSLYLSPMVIAKKEGITAGIPVGFPTELVFRGDGSATASAKVTLNLKSFYDTLDVLASTGRVKVVKH